MSVNWADIHQHVKEVSGMRVRIRCIWQDALPAINADGSEVGQVLMPPIEKPVDKPASTKASSSSSSSDSDSGGDGKAPPVRGKRASAAKAKARGANSNLCFGGPRLPHNSPAGSPTLFVCWDAPASIAPASGRELRPPISRSGATEVNGSLKPVLRRCRFEKVEGAIEGGDE